MYTHNVNTTMTGMITIPSSSASCAGVVYILLRLYFVVIDTSHDYLLTARTLIGLTGTEVAAAYSTSIAFTVWDLIE